MYSKDIAHDELRMREAFDHETTVAVGYPGPSGPPERGTWARAALRSGVPGPERPRVDTPS